MHPKNSTTPLSVQQPVTGAYEVDEFFAVRPGVPVGDTLETASCRLSEAILLAHDALEREEGLKLGAVYLLEQQLINAKALVDASVSGLYAIGLDGGAQ